jgi:DNA ligase-1
MLASDATKLTSWDKIKFPVIASPKIDGFRCLTVQGEYGVQTQTRSGLVIENEWTRMRLSLIPAGLDGELIAMGGEDLNLDIDPKAWLSFHKIQSAFNTIKGEPCFRYLVFDSFLNPTAPYTTRLAEAKALANQAKQVLGWQVDMLPQTIIYNAVDLAEFEESCVALGHEGICFRGVNGWYKFNRATNNEGLLYKLKRFKDAEAKIVGFVRRKHNSNEQLESPLGFAKRSKAAIGMVELDMIGALKVYHPEFGVFELGSGFDHELAADMYKNWSNYEGKMCTFKYQVHGVKIKPRSGVFKGIRYAADL